ncbi:MAG TPA: histidine kinase [Chitinophagaceae bacterium]|nr:histidine kinase [Chitinophagaceae bacterium]
MKKIPLLLAFIALAICCQAQIDWGRYSQTFAGDQTSNNPLLISAILSENNAFWTINSPTVLKNALQHNKSFTNERPSNFTAITTFDDQPAHFFVTNSGNGQYEYRVLKNIKEVVTDWTPVTTPASANVRAMSTLNDLMYIGSFKAAVGQLITVDLRRRNQPQILSSAVVAWRPARPVLFNIYTVSELNEFLKRLSQPHGYYMTERERNIWRTRYSKEELDEVTGLPHKLVVESKDNGIIFMLRAEVRRKDQVQYELVKDNTTIRPWGDNEFDNNFIWLKDLAPGNYTLRVRYAVQPANTTEYNFEVKSPPGSTTFIIGISSLIAAFLALIIVLLLYLRQKKQSRKESLQRQMLELEMKGLKSQLNPHFVFNSLNSIQGLVNTGRIREANEYIALFAKLMRNTLTLSDVNHAPLQQEIDYLDAYLRLEQLRFNFAYDIHTDPSLHTGEINFPTLLLQPLVENAVKHGMDRSGKGRISVYFEKSNEELVVKITDNGKGFTAQETKDGYGLHLTRQRIRLLNNEAGHQQVTMDVNSNRQDHTQIKLIFKAWIHETKDGSDR